MKLCWAISPRIVADEELLRRATKIYQDHPRSKRATVKEIKHSFLNYSMILFNSSILYTVFWMFQVQVLYVFPFFRLSLKQQKMYPELMVLKPGHQRRSVAFRFLVSDECLVLSEDSEAASRIMFVFFSQAYQLFLIIYHIYHLVI